MGNVQRAAIATIQASRLNGDFTITDLLTGEKINCRGSIGTWNGVNHVDFQVKRRADFEKILRWTRQPMTAINGNWRARAGVLRYTNATGSYAFAVAFHTFNHSVAVAFNSYNPVPYRVIRGMGDIPHEQTATGAWRPGTHFCMWFSDTYRLRGNRDSNWEREMRDAVLRAERLGGVTAPATPTPPSVQQSTNPTPSGLWSVQCTAVATQVSAKRVVDQLRAKGHDAFLHFRNNLYRAWVGRFPTRSAAEALERTLQKQGFETFIVQDL